MPPQSVVVAAPDSSGVRLRQRLERAVVAVLLLDGAAPFWAGAYLPLVDLPQHLALARILGAPHDAAAGFDHFFRLQVGPSPYWGYLAPVWLLAKLMPLELASRIFLSLWAVVLPLSIGRLLRALGRDWRWAAFSLPLIWNSHLFWGFTALLASMPLYFYTVAIAIERFDLGPPDRRTDLRLGGLALAVFLCHVQGFLLLVASLLLLSLLQGGGVRRHARRLIFLVPALALFGLFFASQVAGDEPMSPLHAMHRPRYSQVTGPDAWDFESPGVTLSRLPERIWGAYTDGSDDAIGAAWILLLIVGLIFARGAGEAGRERSPASFRGELLCLLALGCYLCLPYELAGQPYFNTRYPVFAALLAPVFLTQPATGRRRALCAAAAALGFVAHLNAAWKFAAFQRETEGFDAVLARIPAGRRVLGLVFDRGERDLFRLGPHLHFPAYYVARQGGDAGFTFAGLPAQPVRYRPEGQALHPDEWKPWEFDWEEMA
ncbi:MAG: hypothetical protein ABIV06_09835, partial [Thermoanaerobaculia bacterium]